MGVGGDSGQRRGGPSECLPEGMTTVVLGRRGGGERTARWRSRRQLREKCRREKMNLEAGIGG